MSDSNINNIGTVKEDSLCITQNCQNKNVLIYLTVHSGHFNSI